MNKLVVVFLISLQFTCFAQEKEMQRLYEKGQYEELIKKSKFLLINNNSPGLHLLLGRAYTDSRKFSEAISHLKISVESQLLSDPEKAWGMVYLAKCYFVLDKREQAIRLLRECVNREGARKASKAAQKYLNLFQVDQFYSDWKFVEGKYIRFYFQDEKHLANPDEYIQQQELLCKRLFDFFEKDPLKKIDVYVWADKASAFKNLKRPLGFSNADYCIVNVCYDQNKDYELCNMLVKNFIRPERQTKMIKDGLGLYFYKMDKNLFQFARNEIPEDRFYTLELWEEPTKYKRDLTYFVGAAFIDFLVNRGGKKKVIELLKNQTIERANVIYPDFENWIATFEAMLVR